MKKMMLILLIAVLGLVLASQVLAAVAHEFVWVQDDGVRDSHFGVYKDGDPLYLDPVYNDFDIEGLACIGDTIYASSGMDGKKPSSLYTLGIISGNASLSKIADIAVSGKPAYEVASLAQRHDGTLWGYANDGEKGILLIDPVTGAATMEKASRLKVEALAWISDTLWLAGDEHFYKWNGNEIVSAFDLKNVEIEAMDAVDGHLWIGYDKDGSSIVAVDPKTGKFVPGGFKAGDDIEGLTFCSPAIKKTPTAIATTPVPVTTKDVTGEPSTTTPTPTATFTPTPTFTATSVAVATATSIWTETPPAPTDLEDDDEPMTDFYEVFLPATSK